MILLQMVSQNKRGQCSQHYRSFSHQWVTNSDYWFFCKEFRSVSSGTLNCHLDLWCYFSSLMSLIISLPSSFTFYFKGWWWFIQEKNTACSPMYGIMWAELRKAWCYLLWDSYVGLKHIVVNFSHPVAHSWRWTLPPLTLPLDYMHLRGRHTLYCSSSSPVPPSPQHLESSRNSMLSCLIPASWTWCSSFD